MRAIDSPHEITPQKYDFEGEILKNFDFLFNIHTYFPESGSRKHFHASEMRAIDFSHKITSKKVIFAKFQKNFSEVLLQSLPSLS